MSMYCRVILSLALLATFDCPTAEGKLLLKPRNTDVKVSLSTYFNCSSDIGSTAIFWFNGRKFIYTGFSILEPYQERFRVEKQVWNGTYIYNLVIHSVQPGDAGEYRCEEDEGFGEKYSVQLVVLDNDPICRSNKDLDKVIGQNTCNIEPDEVELECSVTFHGNIPPQLEWKEAGANSSTPIIQVSVAVSKNNFVSTLKLKGDVTLSNSFFVYETKGATQVPSRCNSTIIKILYAVSDNSAVNQSIDEEIHCRANTSQSCNYTWKWLENNDVTTESSNAVLKATKLGWHRCEAECQIGNTTCSLVVGRALVYGETVFMKTMNKLISVAISTSTVAGICCVVMFFTDHLKRCYTGSSISKNMKICFLVSLFVSLVVSGSLTFALDYSGSNQMMNTLISTVVCLVVSLVACCASVYYFNELWYTDMYCHEREFSNRPIQSLRNEEVIPLQKPQTVQAGLPAINGITILDKEAFITRENRPDIEVYNSLTFQLMQRLNVDGMTNPTNIVSCTINNSYCLYAVDKQYQEQLPAIVRFNPNNGDLFKAWHISGNGIRRLSVGGDTNVILSTHSEPNLHEYTEDGELFRTINLRQNVPSDSLKLGKQPGTRAIKLDSGLFVVFYYGYSGKVYLLSTIQTASTLGRIDEVEILKEFGADPEESIYSLKWPVYFSANKEGSILISDELRKRAILLSENLDNPRILISEEHGMGIPCKTCFDESTGIWLVADRCRIVACSVVDENIVERKFHDLISD